MRNAEIEELVEEIARTLGRGLSLEDLDGILLAYSANQPHADRVRVNFLLSKRVPADVSRWQLAQGVASAVRPVVVPANADLGMLGRVCVPLLVRGFRVGYLWVQQDVQEPSATAILAQLPSVRDTLELLATLLLESNTAESSQRRGREQEFLRAVAGERAVVEAVAEWPEIRQRGPWQVGVIYASGAALVPEDPHAAALVHRSAGLQATVGVDAALFTAGRASHAVVLLRAATSVSSAGATQGRGVQERVLSRYATELQKHTGGPPAALVLGASLPFASLRALPDAYREASVAAQAAVVDPVLGPVLNLRDAGVYGILAGGAATAADSVLFQLLQERPDARELLPVLELLYDNDGAVAQVASALHLHRSTVYHRLARVRGILGADPLAGRVRQELHLAVKAARWASRPRL